MKVPVRQIESFLRAPPPQADAILIYGPDRGMVMERTAILARIITPDPKDPFLASALTKDEINADSSRFFDEAYALSMLAAEEPGKRGRLLRIREGDDYLTSSLKEYLDKPNPETLILIEGADLGPRSSLRKLCEGAANAAAVPCYLDDMQSLHRIISGALGDAGYRANPDALLFLCEALAGDRHRARQEINKLLLYKGGDSNLSDRAGPGRAEKHIISLEDAQACCGQPGAQGLDELVMAIGSRQTVPAVSSLGLLLQEGVPPILIVRSLVNHFRRLHEAGTHILSGLSAAQAADALRPPLFFKHKPLFLRQLSEWSVSDSQHVLLTLADLEKGAKSGGPETQLMLAHTLMQISQKRKKAS